jgi:hypothetical protein
MLFFCELIRFSKFCVALLMCYAGDLSNFIWELQNIRAILMLNRGVLLIAMKLATRTLISLKAKGSRFSTEWVLVRALNQVLRCNDLVALVRKF